MLDNYINSKLVKSKEYVKELKKMEVTFLKHAKTDLNGKGYIATKKDYFLNEIGREECLRNVFSPNSFNSVYCSPYKRTIETAKIVYPYLEFVILSNLVQRDLGVLNEKMKKDYSIEYLKSVREYLINPENAETLEDIMERLNAFFEYIKLQHDDNSRILVVTHNGIMRIIKRFYLNEVNNIDSQNLGQFKMILKK